MNRLFACLLVAAAVSGCAIGPVGNDESDSTVANSVKPVRWTTVESMGVAALNNDLTAGVPTMDLAVYFPSNVDPAFKKVTLDRLMGGIAAAKEIYRRAGVQINLLWVKTGEVNPAHLAIQANEVPGVPETEYVNVYQHLKRHPARPTAPALDAFRSIVEPHKDNARTIYLVVLEDVFFPFLTVSEGRNWTMKTVRTGGLSFATYAYVNTLPAAFRGIITISNLTRPDRYRRTVAHEIGHKVMNVSHEYMTTSPGHEVYADGGLMLYGKGEDIPSGAAGRWHLERLHLSPFLYRRAANGEKLWNVDYKEGGHYYDPLYGDKVVHFDGTQVIDPNW